MTVPGDIFGGMRLHRIRIKTAWWDAASGAQRRQFNAFIQSLGWPGGGWISWLGDFPGEHIDVTRLPPPDL